MRDAETVPIGVVWDAAMDDVDTAPIAALPPDVAMREYKRMMRKYNRLKDPPRHLTDDQSWSLDEIDADLRWAEDLGASLACAQLIAMRERELARREKLAAWRGRPHRAWRELACRLHDAINNAIDSGVLVRGSDEHRHARAATLDCEQRADIAWARCLRGWGAFA